MALQFRIFSAESSGQSGAGGGVVPIEVTNLIPTVSSPYLGQGPRYIYKKYFLNIIDYSSQTGLPVISSVSVSSITDTSATVNWSTSEPTTTELQYGTTLVYGNSIDSGSVYTSGARSVTINGLDDTTTYYYKITAVDIDDLSAYYYGSFNTIDLTAPSFSNVQSSNITSSSASITWTTDEPATTQVTYGSGVIDQSSTYNGSLIINHAVLLTNLSGDTQYRYKVHSIDAYGNSGVYPAAGSLTFNTLGTSGTPVLTITGTTSGGITDTSGSVVWYTSHDADTRIKYSTSASAVTGTGIGDYVTYYNGTYVTGHTGYMTSLTPSTRYYFQAVSSDSYGQTTYSPSVSGTYSLLTTDTIAPVVIFLSTTPYNTSGTVLYSTNEIATGYVQYDTSAWYNATGTFRNIKTGQSGTSHTGLLNSLTENVTYTYRIMAVDPSYNTGYDSTRTFTTLDTTPPVISAPFSGVTSGSIIFNWTTNEISTSELYIGTGTTSAPAIFTGVTGNNNNYVLSHTARVTGLTPETQYVWVIESTDPSSNSSSSTGLITTQSGVAPSGDTTGPIITNLAVNATISTASAVWDTDELSSTIIDYGTGASLSTYTSATGASGTIGHNVSISNLIADTQYYFRVTSTDISSNATTTPIDSFATLTDSGDSNLAIGDTVCSIEFEVPVNLVNKTVPIRACVPVRDNDDLTYTWVTDAGDYVQREVFKKDGADQAKIVEVVFPYYFSNHAAGTTVTIDLIVQSASPTVTWDQNTFGTDTELIVTMPSPVGETYSKTKSFILQAGNFIQESVRGGTEAFGAPYMRTVKLYNRCKWEGGAGNLTNYHPELYSFQTHAYLTYYNKNVFPDFCPQIDLRVSNAWIDESNPTGSIGIAQSYYGATGQQTRGAIYYKSIALKFPTAGDNIYSIAPDILEYGMSEQTTVLNLVQPLGVVPNFPNPHPDGDVNVWLGGSQANYNALYGSDQSNHAFFPGTALMYRLGMYIRGDTTSKALMKAVAGCKFVGFVYKNSNTAVKRNWSNCRSFSPLNIYCPSVPETVGNFNYNGYYGREGIDMQAKAAYSNIVSNLTRGEYDAYDAIGQIILGGGGPGYINGDPSNPYPIQFGPYRPAWDPDGGAVGGTRIQPWDGFNHSKYSVLWKLLDHKMMSCRHFQRMYSSYVYAGGFNVGDGSASSFSRWVTLGSNQSTNPTLLNGGENIVGKIPFQQVLDNPAYWFSRQWPGAEGNATAPWNKPTIAVTEPPTPNQGCSYHNDLVNYVGGGYSVSQNGHYHLNRLYSTIDHAHQIRYAGNMITCAEMLRDAMCIDDLVMQAEINMLSMAHHPTNSVGYTAGYNLAENYYGFDRTSGGGYLNPGIVGLQHQGAGMGRVYAWPLWTIVAAYQLYFGPFDTNGFRAYTLDNLKLHAKIYSDGFISGLGSLTRMYGYAVLAQHPGLYLNGLSIYLQPGVDGSISGYDHISLYDTSYGSTDTVVSTPNVDTLIGEFVASNSTSAGADSPYDPNKAYNGDITFNVDNWINASGSTNSSPSWKVSIWAKSSSAVQYRIRAKLYLRNAAGVESRLSNHSLNADEFSSYANNTVNPQKLEWIIKQSNPFNDGLYESFSPYQNGEYHSIVVKLYARAESATTITTYHGSDANNSKPIVVNTSIKDIWGCPYDHVQIFEMHLMHLAELASISQVVKPRADLLSDTDMQTRSTTILTALRQFYNEFYSLDYIDRTKPGFVDNSSTWVKGLNAGQLVGGESWVMAVAYNTNHPNGSTAPFSWGTQAIVEEGKYSSEPIDEGQYSSYSSMIGLLSMLSLGDTWSNSVSETNPSYTTPFLLLKWCQMSKISSDPFSHRDYIYSTNDQHYLSNNACAIGFINYYQDNPGIQNAQVSRPSVPNVRVYLLDESRPRRIELASTPNVNDNMSGASQVYSEGQNVYWNNNGIASTAPSFQKSYGRSNAVTLYNREGVFGGEIAVEDDYTSSIPFWVRYSLDENNTSTTGYIRLGVVAGGGSPGIVTPGSGVFETVVPPITYYNDPSGDMLRHIGATAGGTNSVYYSSNKYYFTFNGDEALEYVCDFSVGAGNINGLLRISETYSSSFPVWNGGLTYLTSAGVTVQPTGLTGSCTLNQLTQIGNNVVATYTDSTDGSHNKKYTIGIEGKSLRIKMECLDAARPYSGNYITASLGVASGCNSAAIVELCGNSMNPIASFLDVVSLYYISRIPDFTQSYAQDWSIPNPATGSLAGGIVNHGYSMIYHPSTGNTLVNNVNETHLVCVSSFVKDTFITSTAPVSPFRNAAIVPFHLLISPVLTGSNADSTWASSSTSVLNLVDAMNTWGFENVAIYTYDSWSVKEFLPDWYPALDPANFATVVQAANNYGYTFGVYVLYSAIQGGSDYYSTGRFSKTTSGTFKIPSEARSGEVIYSINAAHIPEVVQQDITYIKDNYNVTNMYYDVVTYQFPSIADTLDQGNIIGSAKNIRDGIIYHKLAFDSVRQIVSGALWGEGALGSYTTDMQWLYHGYVDAGLRALPTNIELNAEDVPSGSVRSPTNWWTAVDYEWLVHQPRQAQQGMSIEDRFFGPSDYDVAYTKTGGWQYSNMYPFTTGAMDRIRAYTFSHARCGFITSNGYHGGTDGVTTFEQLITHYYMTNAVQQYMYSAPVDTIYYYSAGSWQSFDEKYYSALSMNAFTGTAVNINLTNGFRMYINHNQVPGNTLAVSLGSNTFTLPRDGFVAQTDNESIVAFNAAVSGTLGNTTGNVIQYVRESTMYEFFHGKGTTTRSFGNISTSSNNASQMKLYNYTRGITVYSTTGSSTFPSILVSDGYV